jgi:hypothetical protein
VEERPNPLCDLERIRASVETGLDQLHQLLQGLDGARVRLCLCDDARAVSFGRQSYCTLDGEGTELTVSGTPQRFVLRDDAGRQLCVPPGRWASMAAAGTELALVGSEEMCRLRTVEGPYLCLQEGPDGTGFGAVTDGPPALWRLRRV